MNPLTVALVGNPNAGKTTVFNALTGSRQRVGNWPGVTVERKEGEYQHHGRRITVVDLPGIYTLEDTDQESALDEQVARAYLLTGRPDVIVNVVDASNLERNLYLTTQLLELGIPVVVALTMTDVAVQRQMPWDAAVLADQIGCPVVPLVAHRHQGIPALRQTLTQSATLPTRRVLYPESVETALATLLQQHPTWRRWQAV